ncbi:MAG: hypothetical protein WCT20_00275 [Candidatus Babeliales bacterium]
MLAIFRSWIDALAFFSPRILLAFIKDAAGDFVRAMWLTLYYFHWLVIFDAVWFICFGNLVVKAYQVQKDNQLTLGGGALMLILVSAIVWSVLTIIIFLYLRKPTTVEDIKRYTAEFFLRYIQLGFFFSLIVLFCLMVLVGLGIRHFPGVHWSLKIIVKMFQLLAAFYWFDSSFSLKEMASSIEKTINVMFYKLPLVVLFFCIIACCDALFLFAFQSMLNTTQFQHLLFTEVHIEQAFVLSGQPLDVVYALGVRYVKLIIEFFLIALLYGFYRSQKDLVSTVSFFDQSTHDEPNNHNDDSDDE